MEMALVVAAIALAAGSVSDGRGARVDVALLRGRCGSHGAARLARSPRVSEPPHHIASACPQLPPHTVRFQRAQIIDRNGFEHPMVASTVLVPAGRRMRGVSFGTWEIAAEPVTTSILARCRPMAGSTFDCPRRFVNRRAPIQSGAHASAR